MHRLFSDLVMSRDEATARRAPLAFPASLVLHATAATAAVLVPLLTREALPHVETPPTRIPGFVTLPRSAGDGIARPPAPPRPPRRAPPRSMAFVPSLLPAPENESLDVPAPEGTEPVGGPPCLIGCDAGGVPGDEPGGGILGPGAPPPTPPAPIRTGGDIRPPLKVRNFIPAYPEVARAARIQGDVMLDCTISNEGRMVMTPMFGGDDHVRLPDASNGRNLRNNGTLAVRVRDDGSALLGDHRVETLAQLTYELRDRPELLPESARLVRVEADASLPYSRVAEVPSTSPRSST